MQEYLHTNGSFVFIENEDGTDVIAELRVGYNIPLIGKLIDMLSKVDISTQLKALKQHMREEGENLRNLLESSNSRVIYFILYASLYHLIHQELVEIILHDIH